MFGVVGGFFFFLVVGFWLPGGNKKARLLCGAGFWGLKAPALSFGGGAEQPILFWGFSPRKGVPRFSGGLHSGAFRL